MDLHNVGEFLESFPDSEFYRPPAEIVREECARDNRGHFNLIHHDTGFKADIYLAGSDPLHRWALERRQRIDEGGAPFALAPPEYVILRKLEYWREGGSAKHLRDVRAIVASDLALDRDFLDREIRERGLTDAWRQVSQD